MYPDIFRKLIGLIGWGVLRAVWTGLALWLALTNYQSLVSALELWNVEKKGIGDDELLGQIFSGVLGDASLVHGFAFAMAAGISGALFVACKTLFDIWNLRDDRAVYRRLRNPEEEHNVEVMIRSRTRQLLSLTLPLIGALYLDVELFIYRSLNATAGVFDPSEAAAGTLHWSALPGDASNIYAANLALHAGPGGYICIAVLVSCLLEVAIRRADEAFRILSQLIGSTWGGEHPEQQEQESLEQKVTPSTTGAATHQTAATTKEDLTSQEKVPERVAVIGGTEGESITLSEAQRDSQRYYMDIATRSVWDRAHWVAIHGVDQSKQERRTA